MNPYYEEAGIQIYHGDCREILPSLSDVDLILADPPYGIDYQSAWRIDRAQWKPKITNDERPFIWWLFDAYLACADIAALACFCRWDVQEAFRLAIGWAGFTLKSQVIWNRVAHGMGDLNGAFAPQHDVIWFASKGAFKFPGQRPKSVITQPRLGAEDLIHPNEKPVWLMGQLIGALTRPSALVVDPCCGSGSTLKAAKELNRRAVGVDTSEANCEIAANRLRQEVLSFV